MNFDLKKGIVNNDYRFCILSFLKTALSKKYPQDFEDLYKSNNMKSFTFNTYFGGGKITKDVTLVESKKMVVTFTSLDAGFMIELYNSMLGMIKIEYPMRNGEMMTLTKVRIENNNVELKEKNIIKFLSPLIVRRHDEKGDWYYSYDEKDFNEYLNQNCKNIFTFLGIESMWQDIKLTPLKSKTVVVKNDKLFFNSNIGYYILEGNREVLSILYQTGLGCRRSQGFGSFSVEVRNG